jgi:hypothetical protein
LVSKIVAVLTAAVELNKALFASKVVLREKVDAHQQAFLEKLTELIAFVSSTQPSDETAE